ncbi:MAG: hypothetical protein ACRD3P_10110 [Terriglobales bacterium]
MAQLFSHAVAFLLGSGVTVAVIVTAILANPEKVEKWLALFWQLVIKVRLGLRFAHKRYVQHDFQGSVNEFIKKHSKEMPGFQVKGVKLEWVDADEKRQAFIEADRVVVRVKRNDPHHETFVKAVYLFVSTSLLYRAKRYISPPQGRAIDLFVSTEIFREQKPEVVDHFLEEYLHPHLDESSERVAEYFDNFDVISTGGLFFPVFLQEMDYLGQKIFGNRKSQQIVTEVKALVEFLKTLALRKVGDERTDLNFVQQYCRFAVVIVGKPFKLIQSISPYVNFVRTGLDRNMETVYLIGRSDNEQPIKQVCHALSDTYDLVSEKRMTKVLMYGEEKRKISGFVAVLRSRNRPLYASSELL